MEAARLDPEGGGRASGALEDGGSDASGVPESPNDGCERSCPAGGAEGTHHAGRAEDPGTCTHEGSGDNGPAPSSNEGPRSTASSSNEGPRSTASSSNEGPCDARACNTEGPQSPDSRTDGPQSPVSSSSKGPQSPDSCSRASGPGRPVSSIAEGPCVPSADSRDGPRRPAISTTGGPCHSRLGITEGPQSPDTSGTKGPGNGETPSDARGNGCEEHEIPGNRTSEGPGASRATTAKQRTTENPHSTRTGTEESNASGANSPTEPDPARPDSTQEHADPGQGDGPSEDPWSTGPFKKPVTPARPDSHEKTLEPRNKPASELSGGPGGEAAPNVSARLPSDAYKAGPAIPYREPPWSGRPQNLYSLEVLKNGAILSTKSLNDTSWSVFGRLPVCHISLEHPSVSRYHAVLQYRSVPGYEPDQETGFYVYDLGSTHGTFINKQKIQPKTYCRFRVGHVLKFGGSTRLFILQGPDEDQEAESDLTVTQIKEARRQREILQKKMLGDDSDEDDDLPEEEGRGEPTRPAEESGCMWGMGEDAMEEEENEENPIALQFQEEREALYLKDPKKTLQGFFDREGEELEFEYDERCPGSWICRVKLPVDDSSGKQLVAEINHSGKKKDAARLCSLEACRMLDMRGLLRQEAVSRKRKAKKWEDEDFYDSDDDTFLDRTGIVEKKRLTRMKKAGKIEDKPETFESLTTKLELVEKEMEEIGSKLKTSHTGESQPSAQDSLDAFMTEIRAGSSMDSVSRKKLHLQSLELKKEQQRLKTLIKIVQPTKLPELQTNPAAQDPKAKKLTLPMFGAMKGGSKFKLKTGTVGKLPPKRTDLPASLFTMKDDDNEVEEEEEEDEDVMKVDVAADRCSEDRHIPEAAGQSSKTDIKPKVPETKGTRTDEVEQSSSPDKQQGSSKPTVKVQSPDHQKPLGTCTDEEVQSSSPEKRQGGSKPTVKVQSPDHQKPLASQSDTKIPKPAPEKQKKMYGPSKPPQVLSTKYPEDDPDYCVWTPPAGQTGDGKTHLNEKYGY